MEVTPTRRTEEVTSRETVEGTKIKGIEGPKNLVGSSTQDPVGDVIGAIGARHVMVVTLFFTYVGKLVIKPLTAKTQPKQPRTPTHI